VDTSESVPANESFNPEPPQERIHARPSAGETASETVHAHLHTLSHPHLGECSIVCLGGLVAHEHTQPHAVPVFSAYRGPAVLPNRPAARAYHEKWRARP
jgi:hypothetical protein